MTDRLQVWMEGYLRAWSTNHPEDIATLFADDARYFTTPHGSPWSGKREIVEGWLEGKDQPGSFTFEWAPLEVTPDLAIVTARTVYRDDGAYQNLWLVRLTADGRCQEFTEWWMGEDDGSG